MFALVSAASALTIGGPRTDGARSILACGVRISVVSCSEQASMAGTEDQVFTSCQDLLVVPRMPTSRPVCCAGQAEDSLPDDLLAAMDAAAELQGDVNRPDSDADQLDVAALRQSLADLSRLDSGQGLGAVRAAKADEQRWKQAFGSDTAWSKCPRPQQPMRPPTRSRS